VAWRGELNERVHTVKGDTSLTASPWYASFFGEEYFDIYGPMLSEDRTAREVEGIIKLLDLPHDRRILDLACGHGRHAIPLAQHGYQVTGQDLSAVFLNRVSKRHGYPIGTPEMVELAQETDQFAHLK
jgi:cyclopropane fatty-acyl-phospholipid synthase-like methyltransferase